MSCKPMRRMHDYRCGDVGRADLPAIEAHLMVCDDCLRNLGEYELTIRLARSTAWRGARPPLQ